MVFLKYFIKWDVGYAAGGCDVVLTHLALVERLTDSVLFPQLLGSHHC